MGRGYRVGNLSLGCYCKARVEGLHGSGVQGWQANLESEWRQHLWEHRQQTRALASGVQDVGDFPH